LNYFEENWSKEYISNEVQIGGLYFDQIVDLIPLLDETIVQTSKFVRIYKTVIFNMTTIKIQIFKVSVLFPKGYFLFSRAVFLNLFWFTASFITKNIWRPPFMGKLLR